MAKHRLLQSQRQTLYAYVNAHIKPQQESDAVVETYNAALPLVLSYVEKKWPQATMLVLDKYGVAKPVHSVRLMFPDGDVKSFELNGATLRPDIWSDQMFQVDETTAAAVEAWLAATEILDDETRKRTNAYRALISGSTYLEDLHKIWPESQTIVPLVGELIPLGPEQLGIIKCDLKERGLND